jgi:hypothetical protein
LLYRKHHIFISLIAMIGVVFPLSAQSLASEDGSDSAVAPIESAKVEPPKPVKRLFGVLPNYRTVEASIPFTPLAPRQKLTIAAKDSFDWPTFPTAAVLTFAMRGKDDAKNYGTGWVGFGNRYARNVSNQIIGNMFTEGFLPIVLHQDPRYFRVGSGSFFSRLRNSLVQIAVARNDAGRKTFNSSEFIGNTIATGIATSYSPNLRSWSAGSENVGLMIATDMFSNVAKEFGPDLKERFLHRHHKGTT